MGIHLSANRNKRLSLHQTCDLKASEGKFQTGIYKAMLENKNMYGNKRDGSEITTQKNPKWSKLNLVYKPFIFLP